MNGYNLITYHILHTVSKKLPMLFNVVRFKNTIFLYLFCPWTKCKMYITLKSKHLCIYNLHWHSTNIKHCILFYIPNNKNYTMYLCEFSVTTSATKLMKNKILTLSITQWAKTRKDVHFARTENSKAKLSMFLAKYFSGGSLEKISKNVNFSL